MEIVRFLIISFGIVSAGIFFAKSSAAGNLDAVTTATYHTPIVVQSAKGPQVQLSLDGTHLSVAGGTIESVSLYSPDGRLLVDINADETSAIDLRSIPAFARGFCLAKVVFAGGMSKTIGISRVQ